MEWWSLTLTLDTYDDMPIIIIIIIIEKLAEIEERKAAEVLITRNTGRY